MKFHWLILILFVQYFIPACYQEEDPSSGDKYKKIVTKYTEIQQIVSQEVNDTFYIYIRLPKSYNTTNNTYPVLYLLDGDISFNLATSLVRYLQFGKDIPEMILVAPGYGTMLSDRETNFRERDYTLSKVERFAESGNAKNYINFLQNELIPFIDKSYRTNSERVINGYSLGGLLAIKIYLSYPNLFNNYIAGSPYLINDINELLEINLKDQGSVKLFLSVGEQEDKEKYHKPIIRFIKKLKEKSTLKVQFKVFKNGTHFTCPSEALTYGLKYIYNDK